MKTVLLVLAAVTILTSGSSQPSRMGAPTTPGKEAAHAIALINQTCADAWNRGDLKGYLAAYADDVVMVYESGPEKGMGLLEARLRRSQRWDGHRPRNLARIGHSEVLLLDPDHALQTAEIIIQEPAQEVHLWATTLLKRTNRGWIVIHEQSF